MKLVVLASGSEGNSTFLSSKETKVLFDIGKNARYIETKLQEINENARDIKAIVISHTHDDHVSALKVFLKKNHPTVYVTEKQYHDLEILKDYDQVVIYEDDFTIDDITVKSIKTSHDVSDSRNFVVKIDQQKVVYLTDTGYLNRKYFSILENCEYYLFESNHDIEMLLNGSYPKWLKQRVLGTQGHLSNKDSSFYLAKLIGNATKKIVLMHLSKHNNTEQLALKTLQDTFLEYDLKFNDVICAKQNEITGVCDDQDNMSRENQRELFERLN